MRQARRRRPTRRPSSAGTFAQCFRSTRAFGLRRRHPLEQISVREKQAAERPQNRVRHQPRLVGKKNDASGPFEPPHRQIRQHVAEIAPLRNSAQPRVPAPSRNGMSAGIAIVARTNLVHNHGETSGISQPASSVRSMQGAERVRRKLSSIFQRPTTGSAALRPVFRSRALQSERSTASNCQSPRSPAMLPRGGIFVVRRETRRTVRYRWRAPSRAKIPSKRSWLSRVFSSHFAGRARRSNASTS